MGASGWLSSLFNMAAGLCGDQSLSAPRQPRLDNWVPALAGEGVFTAEECARTLLRAGAAAVDVLTLARVVRPRAET